MDGDFSTGNSDGSSASSSVLSYGLTLPAAGSGSSFTTTIDMSDFDQLNTSEVSQKLTEGLRQNSPSISVRKSIKITIRGSSFELTMITRTL